LQEEELDLPRTPFIGNGDAYDQETFWNEVERTGVDTIMVARGALIKPWIFTELKERRTWDISAQERLQGIADFARYGLEHWGSDEMGINLTRRFMLESLSFTHRYVPVGLLERLPAKMNDRPFAYHGRSDLETLLASPKVDDWQKIW
jgi:tRNA-dihydrouridine synthase 3